MNKYIVFAWDSYYPAGGLWDIVEYTDDLEEAKAICQSNEFRAKMGKKWYIRSYEHIEVVDRDTWETVWSNV